MLFHSVLFTILLPIISAKTIAVNVSGGKFSPTSIAADVGDTVEIHAQTPSDSFALIEADSINHPCSEATNKRLFLTSTPASNQATCQIMRTSIAFTVPDTNPLIVFGATPGQCVSGLALDINVKGADQMTMLANLAASTKEVLLPGTLPGCALSGSPIPLPTSSSHDETRLTALEARLIVGIFIACVAFSLVGLIIGGIAWHFQRKKRVAKYAYFKNTQPRHHKIPITIAVPPPASRATDDGFEMDQERQPLKMEMSTKH